MTFNKRGSSDLTVTSPFAARNGSSGFDVNSDTSGFLSSASDPSITTGDGQVPAASLADISDGAMRLAHELDHYINQGSDLSSVTAAPTADKTVSEDDLAYLQLATARKLREVCRYKS